MLTSTNSGLRLSPEQSDRVALDVQSEVVNGARGMAELTAHCTRVAAGMANGSRDDMTGLEPVSECGT